MAAHALGPIARECPDDALNAAEPAPKQTLLADAPTDSRCTDKQFDFTLPTGGPMAARGYVSSIAPQGCQVLHVGRASKTDLWVGLCFLRSARGVASSSSSWSPIWRPVPFPTQPFSSAYKPPNTVQHHFCCHAPGLARTALACLRHGLALRCTISQVRSSRAGVWVLMPAVTRAGWQRSVAL